MQDPRCPAVGGTIASEGTCEPIGLTCGYSYRAIGSDEISVATCAESGKWSAFGATCRIDCPVRDGGDLVDASAGGPCDERPVVDCTSPQATNQLALDSAFVGVAVQCSVRTAMTVFFDRGCATRVWAPAGDPSTACVVNAVAGKRFLCAANVACGFVAIPQL